MAQCKVIEYTTASFIDQLFVDFHIFDGGQTSLVNILQEQRLVRLINFGVSSCVKEPESNLSCSAAIWKIVGPYSA